MQAVNLHRTLWRLALAALLVFGQQGAVLHELSHGMEDARANHGGVPHPEVCEKCVAFAGFAGSLSPAIVVVPVLTPANRAIDQWAATAHDAPIARAYQSRAPPIAS